jgi:hypothetical protein
MEVQPERDDLFDDDSDSDEEFVRGLFKLDRHQDLASREEIDAVIKAGRNENTVAQNKWALGVFSSWLEQHRDALRCDSDWADLNLENMSDFQLNDCLSRFVAMRCDAIPIGLI